MGETRVHATTRRIPILPRVAVLRVSPHLGTVCSARPLARPSGSSLRSSGPLRIAARFFGTFAAAKEPALARPLATASRLGLRPRAFLRSVASSAHFSGGVRRAIRDLGFAPACIRLAPGAFIRKLRRDTLSLEYKLLVSLASSGECAEPQAVHALSSTLGLSCASSPRSCENCFVRNGTCDAVWSTVVVKSDASKRRKPETKELGGHIFVLRGR